MDTGSGAVQLEYRLRGESKFKTWWLWIVGFCSLRCGPTGPKIIKRPIRRYTAQF